MIDSPTPTIRPDVTNRPPMLFVQKLLRSAPRPMAVTPTNATGRMPKRRMRTVLTRARNAWSAMARAPTKARVDAGATCVSARWTCSTPAGRTSRESAPGNGRPEGSGSSQRTPGVAARAEKGSARGQLESGRSDDAASGRRTHLWPVPQKVRQPQAETTTQPLPPSGCGSSAGSDDDVSVGALAASSSSAVAPGSGSSLICSGERWEREVQHCC